MGQFETQAGLNFIYFISFFVGGNFTAAWFVFTTAMVLCLYRYRKILKEWPSLRSEFAAFWVCYFTFREQKTLLVLFFSIIIPGTHLFSYEIYILVYVYRNVTITGVWQENFWVTYKVKPSRAILHYFFSALYLNIHFFVKNCNCASEKSLLMVIVRLNSYEKRWKFVKNIYIMIFFVLVCSSLNLCYCQVVG